MNFLTILPMAVVMVAGTQLVAAAVFLASGDRPRRASLGFLTGAAIVVLVGPSTCSSEAGAGVTFRVAGPSGGRRRETGCGCW
ncbi:hypothetical protein [Micromonospora matsumotoense]|uniref:hypothetical protein n=1 Tax=Micromonospora matsumotoense TaxID=121616 RepID=UPI0033D47922